MSALPVPPISGGQPAPAGKSAKAEQAKKVLPSDPKTAAIVSLAFIGVLYLIELLDTVLPGDFTQAGIRPRELSGLAGILWAPLFHLGWAHLLSNTIPVLVFSFLAMAGGFAQWISVTATIWILGGLGVWLVSPAGSVTVGASGLAFGWLTYLLVRGIFHRGVAQILVGVVLLFLWGGMLWGVLPGDPRISWQGHLFSALAGVLAAWLSARAARSRPTTTDSPAVP